MTQKSVPGDKTSSSLNSLVNTLPITKKDRYRVVTEAQQRMLKNALASKGISKEFKEWIAIAKDRPKWRQQTHSKPKPPDA